MKNVFSFLSDIVSFINPFSENFFVYKLIDLLGILLQNLFVPEEDYFFNKINDMKIKISQKIPYQDYVDMFETVKQVESGKDISISLNNYKIGNMNVNMSKFIDFSWVSKYKNTWYSWVRGFVFVFLIIYNINQVIKLFRGYNVAEGISKANESSGGGKN